MCLTALIVALSQRPLRLQRHPDLPHQRQALQVQAGACLEWFLFNEIADRKDTWLDLAPL